MIIYHHQQNKWYYPRCLLAHFEAIHSFSAVANLLAHNNISQICHCGQISLQSAAVIWILFYNLTSFGGKIYLAGDVTINHKINGTPIDVYLPISKLHSILAVTNLLGHYNSKTVIKLLCASKFGSAKKEYVASKWASKHLYSEGVTIYFAGDGTLTLCCTWVTVVYVWPKFLF